MESNIILYTTSGGSVSVQVQYEDGSFWLTQKRMAELFGVEVPTVKSGKTAAEIIYHSADAQLPHMGLTTWRHAPDGKILKSDVTIAKALIA